MSTEFVHLRVHTEFSLNDGIIRIPKIVEQTKQYGQAAIAVTDQSNMCSLIKFYLQAQKNAIKPICGVDIWLENHTDTPYQMTLLVMNLVGYKNLTELISKSYLENQKNGIALLKVDWIKERSEGLIALSGGRNGDIGHAILNGNINIAEILIKGWMDCFRDRFYIELQRTKRESEEEYIVSAISLAEQFDCPVVATNTVMFLNKNEYEAHETRVCVSSGDTLDNSRRCSVYSEEQYFKTSKQMIDLFSDIPEAIENSVEISKRCTLILDLDSNFLPEFPIPNGMSVDSYFRKISYDGLKKRLKHILLNNNHANEIEKRYIDRLEFELNIIITMGFAGYFLIVMDFIQWSKNTGIPVGPGRGSGAGSLVAYAQKITDLDPIEYGLLFERFLNPERVSMPDFDIDFCMEGRDRVIDYVSEKYGKKSVAQIVTFGTMAAKGVVRDVTRVQGKPFILGDRMAKMIPFEIGMTLEKAYKQEDVLSAFIAENNAAQEVWGMSLQLEGITRNVGKHAGGVVISPTKLTDFVPLYCDEHGQSVVTQFDKNDVETVGLVKFDFLGLRTLTIIDWAVKNINSQLIKRQEQSLDISKINLQDKQVYQYLQTGYTTAVFQLESRGMKDLITRLLPDCFEDIIALVALFRPGPLQSGMVENFINRKHGKESIFYPDSQYQHESLKTVLEPTYGIILYQEQVMKIAQVLAGYTLGDADILRRAMGKKKPEEMAKQRGFFKEGAIKKGIDGELSMKIFDLVEKFAGYGFNKSHSAAYALLSYQTLWLKVHYPSEFMAAVLSSDMQNTDKVVVLVNECKRMGLTILSPDVNSSQYMFSINDQGHIVYGLGAIKGLGEGPSLDIMLAREKGEFLTLYDFCQRVNLKKINKRTLEALISSGALDSLIPNFNYDLNLSRAILSAAQQDAIQTADQIATTQKHGINDIFGFDDLKENHDCYSSFKGVSKWSSQYRLNLEKSTLGFYLTGHPLDEFKKESKYFSVKQIQDIKAEKDKQQNIFGLIVSLRVVKNKNGEKMCFISIDDTTSVIEVSVFSDTYHRHTSILKMDAMIFIKGEVIIDRFTKKIKMIANHLSLLEDARIENGRALIIHMNYTQLHNGFDTKLMNIFQENSGELQVNIHYSNETTSCILILDKAYNINPSCQFMYDLRSWFGEDKVLIDYSHYT